jgi:predicted  nucleic acid-binding Zn-ribbon protein
MKEITQLIEFDNWANDIINNCLSENSNKNKTVGEIPKERDIKYMAVRAYPNRDEDQAIALYLSDKLDDFDKRDLQQNQVINAQRRENEKLKSNFTALQQELQDIETGSKQTDTEVERLKQLSGQLKTDIETRRVSSDEIQRALAEVEKLRNKPGMSDEKYLELKKKIEAAQQNKNGINPEQFKKFTEQLNALNGEQKIEKEQLSRLGRIADQIETERKEISTARSDLENRISNLERRETEISKEIEKEVEEETQELKKRLVSYKRAVDKRSRQASTLIKNFLDKDLPFINLNIDSLNKKINDIEIQRSEPVPGPQSKLHAGVKNISNFIGSTLRKNDMSNKDSSDEQSEVEIKESKINLDIKNNDIIFENGQYLRRKHILNLSLEELEKEPQHNFYRVMNTAYYWYNVAATPQQKEYLKKNYSYQNLYLRVVCNFIYNYAKSVDFDEKRLDELVSRHPELAYKYIVKELQNFGNVPKIDFTPSQMSDTFEDAANKMVDNIIGEQVARWIK